MIGLVSGDHHAAGVVRAVRRSCPEASFFGMGGSQLRDEGVETVFDAHGHIRKYDCEPFMPHHIVESVKEQLAGKTKLSVPMHEIMV